MAENNSFLFIIEVYSGDLLLKGADAVGQCLPVLYKDSPNGGKVVKLKTFIYVKYKDKLCGACGCVTRGLIYNLALTPRPHI